MSRYNPNQSLTNVYKADIQIYIDLYVQASLGGHNLVPLMLGSIN